MRKKYLSYSVLILVLFAISTEAQDFRKAFAQLRKSQFAIVNLDAEITINLYKGDNLVETQNSVIRKQGTNYYTEVGNTIVANLENYSITMTKDDQMMWINPRPEKEPFFLNNITGANIDSLLDAQVKNVQFIGKEGAVCHYDITTGNNMVPRVEYFIDEQKNYLYKMVYYYNPQYVDVYSKVEIVFTKFDTAPDNIASYFNQKNYFVKRNNLFAPSGLFENYTIVKK